MQEPACLERVRPPALLPAVVVILAVGGGCVADFDGLLEPGCMSDEDCPSVGAPCIDARCDNGGCSLEVRACDDGNTCTQGSCDVSLDECVFQDRPDGYECEANALCESGTCTCIDGFDDCDDEPGCEAHLASDPKHCHRCDFECPPGQSCIQAVCGTCSDDGECDDSKTCTVDACLMDGTCQHTLAANACLISGECRTEGQRNPNNQCLECVPGVSQTSWTALRDGETCNDGNDCTIDDRCEGGVCRGKLQDDCASFCLPPNCRDFLGICRPPVDGECLDANGMCCFGGAAGGCECD
jgi:hypothetical protein